MLETLMQHTAQLLLPVSLQLRICCVLSLQDGSVSNVSDILPSRIPRLLGARVFTDLLSTW